MQRRREQSERAETYLRLLVESVLRSTPASPVTASGPAEPGATTLRPAGGRREAADRVRQAAEILVEAGVLSNDQAAEILLALQTAMSARGLGEFRPGRARWLAGTIPEQPAGKNEPWRVIPTAPGLAGQGGAVPGQAALRQASLASTPGSRLMALVITADRMIAPGMLGFPPSAGLPELAVPSFADLVATDDLGTAYALTFTDGSWAGSTWSGTIMLRPAPPEGARVLTINSPNGPLLRAELTAPRQAGQAARAAAAPQPEATARPAPRPSGGRAATGAPRPLADAAIEPIAESPGERLLIRRAEALLGVLSPPSGDVPPSAAVQRAASRAAQTVLSIPVGPGGVVVRSAAGAPAGRAGGPAGPNLAELVSTLERAGLLSPLSPVPARLTTLGQMLGLPGLPSPAHSRAAGDPGAKIPARWATVLSYYGRRSHPAPPPGMGAIGAELPEVDGARFAIAGLRTGWHGTQLHVMARGLRPMMHPPLPELAGHGGFSWWVRDGAGAWHLGIIRNRHPADDDTMLRLALLPPLGPGAAELTVEVTGVTERVTARVCVHW